MKMPRSRNHTRRQTCSRPVDVNGPTLVGANDRLRGHTAMLMFYCSDSSGKKVRGKWGFEWHFITPLANSWSSLVCCADVQGARSFTSTIYLYKRSFDCFFAIHASIYSLFFLLITC